MTQLRRLIPSLNTLVVFDSVMRCGTFAGAAKELGVTGPAVSRTIGRLEFHLGLPLFDRTPAGAVPTRDGDELHSGIARSFGEIEATLTRLKRRVRPARKPVVLSVSSAFATHWFMPRLARFQACFPHEEVQFRLISGPLEGPTGDADVAMRFDHRPEPNDRVVPLMPEFILPVAAPRCVFSDPFGGEPPTRPAQLITLDKTRPDWPSLLSPLDIEPTARELRFSDYSLVVQAALKGQGVALGWLNVVSALLLQGELVPVGARTISTGRQCDLVVRGGSSSVASEVCRWLSGELREDVLQLKMRDPALAIEI